MVIAEQTRQFDQRIRVLRVIARMNVGGPALQVSGLLRHMDPERFEHRLVTGFVGEDEQDFIDLRGAVGDVTRIATLGRRVRMLDDVRSFMALRRVMADFRPHIVHTHTAKAGVLGRLAAWTTGVPATVHTFHGHLLRGYFGRTVTALVTGLERLLARRTTCLVAVGTRVRDELLEAGVGRRDQFRVMAPGVLQPDVVPKTEARRRLGIHDDRVTVAFVGRLTNVKRPDRLLAVAAEVLRVCPATRFLVVGEGDELEDARRLASALRGDIRFLGWRADVGTIYAASDLVLLTSDNEGMPVSLIEAAMVGRPAVTTGVGSAAEVVLDQLTGYVTPTTTEALAAAVICLVDDAQLRRSMGERGSLHARTNFSVARLVEDTQAMYEEILAGPAGVGG